MQKIKDTLIRICFFSLLETSLTVLVLAPAVGFWLILGHMIFGEIPWYILVIGVIVLGICITELSVNIKARKGLTQSMDELLELLKEYQRNGQRTKD